MWIDNKETLTTWSNKQMVNCSFRGNKELKKTEYLNKTAERGNRLITWWGRVCTKIILRSSLGIFTHLGDAECFVGGQRKCISVKRPQTESTLWKLRRRYRRRSSQAQKHEHVGGGGVSGRRSVTWVMNTMGRQRGVRTMKDAAGGSGTPSLSRPAWDPPRVDRRKMDLGLRVMHEPEETPGRSSKRVSASYHLNNKHTSNINAAFMLVHLNNPVHYPKNLSLLIPRCSPPSESPRNLIPP